MDTNFKHFMQLYLSKPPPCPDTEYLYSPKSPLQRLLGAVDSTDCVSDDCVAAGGAAELAAGSSGHHQSV